MQSTLDDVLRIRLPLWLVAPLMALATAIGLGVGYVATVRFTGACPESRQVCENFSNFWKAWQIAADNFVDPSAIKPNQMIDGAISGMLDSLGDRGHTRYLSAETAKEERESLKGRFEGIGAYIDIRDDQPVIVQPIEGSPAERAGIRAGDLILRVNGEDMRGVSIDDLQNKVRGPKGTEVTLTVQHEGEELPINITVKREEVQVPSVSWRMLPNQIALLRLIQFSEPSSEDMQRALIAAQQQGARGLILDLRNNPGGLVNELVDIASQFLPPDTTILLEQDRAGERTPYKTHGGGIATEIPLVVLVNNNTASSGEILAGALKEHNRAKVVGVPTYGTATVLRLFDLNDGAQLRLGTTQWLTPNGEVVRGKGIEPNEVVALPPGVLPLTPMEASELDEQSLRMSKDTQFAHGLDLVEQAVAAR